MAGTMALAGCNLLDDNSSDGPPADHGDQRSAVNIVDAGADPDGETPIDDVLTDVIEDDTHIHFPTGQYRLNEWHMTGYSNLAITGTDAVLVPPEGMQSYWLAWDQLSDIRFEGFMLDNRGEGVAPVTHIGVDGGTNVVRDVAIRGHRVPDQSQNGFELSVTDPNAELRMEGVRLPDGTIHGSGIYTFPDSVGTLTVKNCRIEHWGEGLYASPHSGPLSVIGGYYANNGIAQVRVGGGRNGPLVRSVTVRADNPRNSQFKQNMRGIWLKEGTGARVENCDIAVTDLTGTFSSGGIVVGRQYGSADIVDCHVRVNVPNPTQALIARRPVDDISGETMPSMDRLPSDWTVTCKNISITGTSPSGISVVTVERSGCRYSGFCMRHTHGSRGGFLFNDAANCLLADSTIDVAGRLILTEDSEVSTQGILRNTACRPTENDEPTNTSKDGP